MLLLAAALGACGSAPVVRPTPQPAPPPRVMAPDPAALPVRPAPVPIPTPLAEPLPSSGQPSVTTAPATPAVPIPAWPWVSAPPLDAAGTPQVTTAPLAMTPPPHITDLTAGPAHIVLVLPLESPTFGPAAEAVAAGFSEAAKRADTRVTIIPHGDGGVLPAIDRARQEGATVIVGPLLRDDLKALAAVGTAAPWTLALNQLDDGARLPDQIFTLALSVEGEARQIAQVMQARGSQHVVIVASDSPLQQRFAASFIDEWLLLGGARPTSFRLVRDPESLALLRSEIARTPADAVLLAAGGGDAALVKPYLPQVPVYASSQVHDRQPSAMLRDLDGIRFVEVPLVGDPEAPDLADVPRRDWPNPTLGRLYALGYDAFQVALAFGRGAPQRLDIQGATGRLSLGPAHHVVREGRLMRFEGGSIVPDDR